MNPVNMRVHVNNNGQYKILHPETNGEQVILTNGNLQNYIDTTVPIKIEDGVVKYLDPDSGVYEKYSSDVLALSPLGKITNLSYSIINTKAIIKWTDSGDVSINTSTKSITIAKWKGTKLVVKVGSIPIDEKDGTLLVDSTVKNQYSDIGFTLNNLVAGTTYFIKAFPYTESNVLTNSNDSVVTITPVINKLGNISNLQLDSAGNKAYIRWTDPSDVSIDDIKVATWKGTRVVMKEGTFPSSSTDGTVVVHNTRRDSYANNTVSVSCPDNGKTYYFGFFPYSEEGAETNSTVKGTVTINIPALNPATGLSVTSSKGYAKITWTDPDDKTKVIVTGQTFYTTSWKETKLVRKIGSYPSVVTDGTLVTTNTVKHQYATNPYIDSNLTDGATYYYRLFATGAEGTSSITDVGSTTIRLGDDSSGSPGSANLIAGTKTAGFYGHVPSSQFISQEQLSAQIGLTHGIPLYDDGWLKFSLDDKVLFVAKKSMRSNVRWIDINAVNAVYGNKTITINGLNYKVRLLKGLLANNTLSDNTKGSEWNRLMLPVHMKSVNQSWSYPEFADSTTPSWSNYADSELGVFYVESAGSRSWCQETIGNSDSRSTRGYLGVEYSSFSSSGSFDNTYGWRPVLELV